MKKRELVKGDIVQLCPDYGKGFGGLLLIVTEPKEFGCQGYVLDYWSDEAITYKGKAYLRPSWDKIEYVGRLHWIQEDEEEECV